MLRVIEARVQLLKKIMDAIKQGITLKDVKKILDIRKAIKRK